MRWVLALFLASFMLSGCLQEQPKANAIPDFESELGDLENVSMGNWSIEDLNDSAVDAVFGDMLVEKENVTVVYFYDQGCTACKTLALWLVPEKKKYNSSVIWFEYDIDTADGWEKYALFADSYNVSKSERYVPMVYIGGNHYWGIDGIRYNLTVAIDECHRNGCYSPFEMLKN